jgi:integrase
MTLPRCIGVFLAELSGLGGPTEAQYRDVVRLYIKPRIGDKKLRDLTPTDVTRMLRDMEKPTSSRPDGYGQNARRLARSVLRRAIRWAEVEGIVSRNVAALANPVRVERPDGRTMTPVEARTFLDHIKGDRNEALFVIALSLGLRVSELLALSWEDVNLDPLEGSRPTLTVRRCLKRIKGEGLVIDGVKTKTSRRTIRLPTSTAECLREHRRRQEQERADFPGEWPDRPLDVDLGFRSARGTALDPSDVWSYLSEATKHAGAEYEYEDRTIIKPGTDAAGATYIDLWPALAGWNRATRKEFRRDDLHLNGPGYAAWVKELRPHLAAFADA